VVRQQQQLWFPSPARPLAQAAAPMRAVLNSAAQDKTAQLREASEAARDVDRDLDARRAELQQAITDFLDGRKKPMERGKLQLTSSQQMALYEARELLAQLTMTADALQQMDEAIRRRQLQAETAARAEKPEQLRKHTQVEQLLMCRPGHIRRDLTVKHASRNIHLIQRELKGRITAETGCELIVTGPPPGSELVLVGTAEPSSLLT